jgi:hypothetical protein
MSLKYNFWEEINNKLKDKGVKHWNVVNALEFLSHHDLKMYEKIFTENCIDGQVILKFFILPFFTLGNKNFKNKTMIISNTLWYLGFNGGDAVLLFFW